METKENCQEKKHWRCSFWRCTGYGLLGILGFAVFAVLGGIVIMLLWNWLMPLLFQIPTITFWQAVGIAILARLLFGNAHHGWHRWGRRGWRHSHYCCDNHSHQNWHSFGDKHGDCSSESLKWRYYEQFWDEEGEKAFQDYVKRKSENTDKSQDSNT